MARTAPVPNIPAIPGMNPGVFVMGGGGAGGGKGGRGGNGNGDGQGAGGNNGGQNADGGGKGGNACGQGTGAAACTNPRHGGNGGTSAGDPVDVVTGRVFTVPAIDLGLPGPLPLVLQRQYSSTARERDVGLGFGWSHSLAWMIIPSRRRVDIVQDDGTVLEAPLPAVGESRRLFGGVSLRAARSGFALSLESGVTLLFHEQDALDDVYRLSSMVDRNGNEIRLAYDGPELLTVTDSAGRAVRCVRDASRRIARFEVRTSTAPNGWHAFHRYEYDAAGDLVAVVDAEGQATRFVYSEHLLVEQRLPDGLVVHYRYDRQGRCVETWGARAEGRDPSLADGLPEVLADGKTEAKGLFHTRLAYLDDGYTEVTDASQLKRVIGNANGQAEKVAWGPGVLSHEYDELGNWVSYTDPVGAVTRVERDEAGRAKAVIDPLNRRTEYAYDALGAVTAMVRPDGQEIRFERDARGNVTFISDRLGLVVGYEYDERGLVRRALLPNGGATAFEYDAHGNCTAVTEPSGATKRIAYDDLGRPVAMTNAAGGMTRYAYDARGLLRFLEDPTGARTSYDHDGRKRLVRITDAAGRTGKLTWGGINALCEVERPDGTRIGYRYDRDGRFLELINEQGRVHRYRRNGAGHVVEEETLDGRVHALRRDLCGRLISWRSSSGDSVEYEYDAAGQLVRRVYADDTADEFEYDLAGRLAVARNASSECRRTYDARGCLVHEVLAIGGETYEIRSKHDVMGKRVERSTSLGYIERLTRDAMSDVVRVDWGNEALDIFRDALRREQQVVLPGGGRVAYAYDGLGRLARRTVTEADAAVAAVVPQGEPQWVGRLPRGVVSDVSYAWSPVGLLEQETDALLGVTRYQYDPVGQLVARLPAEAAGELFGYDAAGNLTLDSEEHEHGPGGRTVRLGAQAYHHDKGGRLVAKDVPGGGRWTYAYDARGLLRSVRDPAGQVTELDYDALYRRVEKRVRAGDGSERRVQFVWDGEQMLHELTRGAPAGEAPGAEVRTYCFLDGSPVPLGEIDASGRRRFYVHAPNGFPELVISGSGAIEAAQQHRAFGAIEGGGAGATPLRFPGQYADGETGLYYNRFRYYDPEIGAYISADPIEISRSPRLYGYAENSPPNVVDLDGLQPMTTTIRPSGATGRSAAGRDRNNPAEVHPTVWNNMANQVQVQSPNGTTNWEFPQATRHPANCSEPAALSQHLFDYEDRNELPRGTCGSANDPNNNHLRAALRGIDSIESTQDDGGARNACPNCGVLMRNLQNQANQGRPEGEPPVDLVNRVTPGIDEPSQRYRDGVAAGNPQRTAVEAMQNPNAPGNMAVRPPPNWRPRGSRR
ncbi:RHS repeat-associated core domain-containing protein [Sorangium sp. So ce406]|uniref:RHS repeat-associated core domain-containing protein n=1 Tax=Sorangium sp. So ce406 TaxID=3133311 RepID=UPI003F5BAF5C